MTKYEKALLDLIAYAEGTLGVSQNGYDITFNFYRIIGWTPDTKIVHGGYDWLKSINSTVAGRYQFKTSKWISTNGGKNVPMTKDNQDNAAIKVINERLKNTDIDSRNVKISELESKTKFDIMLQKLAPEWASFPVTKTITHNGEKRYAGKGFYSDQNSGHSSSKLFGIYKKALVLYG